MGGRGGAGGVGGALPALSGSEKQIKWANDIRDNVIRNISETEKMIKWYDKVSPALDTMDRHSQERKDFERTIDSAGEEIARRINRLNNIANSAKADAHVISNRGFELSVDIGYSFERRLDYSKYPDLFDSPKQQRQTAKTIISDAKAFVKSETRSSRWIDTRDNVTKEKVKISGKKATWWTK